METYNINKQEEEFTPSFSEITSEERSVLEDNYCYKQFADVQYVTSLHKGMQFKANVWQAANYRQTGNHTYLNNYASTYFTYQHKNVFIENLFDLDGKIQGKVVGNIETRQLDRCKVFLNCLSNHQDTGKKIKYNFGVYKTFDQIATKVKYSSTKNSLEAIMKGFYELSSTEQIGGGLGCSLGFAAKQFSFYKFSLWYQDQETKMAITHKIPDQNALFRLSKLQYSVYKQLEDQNNTELGIKMIYNQDNPTKKYKMSVGAKTSTKDNLNYGFKINDEFKLGTFFQFMINPTIDVTFSTKFDLNLKGQRNEVTNNKFPFGIRIMMQEKA